MTKTQLLENLASVERIAATSKLKRMLVNPIKYLSAIIHRELFYQRSRKDKQVISRAFFGEEMHLLLPSSTDIYLTGGKSHDSEIRLAKYLINNLSSQQTFVDVGAHYGYFTLLGSTLVGKGGKVCSFEASPKTYHILNKNTVSTENITTHNLAVSDSNKELTFYEFPNLYSEYNTFHVAQFKDEDWYKTYPPDEVKINCVTLDEVFKTQSVNPTIIKIDVEGAELQVIKGMEDYLSNYSPTLIMEYLSAKRGNHGHQEAENLLSTLGYSASLIGGNGDLQPIKSAAQYLQANQIDSDNIVFKKS